MKFIERNLNFIGLLLLTVFAGAAAGLYWDVPGRIRQAVRAQEVAGQYTCPMHPQILRSTPGRCPECGMQLVKSAAAPSGQTPATEPGGGCCGSRTQNAPTLSAGATCPHMAASTNLPSCPEHSHR